MSLSVNPFIYLVQVKQKSNENFKTDQIYHYRKGMLVCCSRYSRRSFGHVMIIISAYLKASFQKMSLERKLKLPKFPKIPKILKKKKNSR